MTSLTPEANVFASSGGELGLRRFTPARAELRQWGPATGGGGEWAMALRERLQRAEEELQNAKCIATSAVAKVEELMSGAGPDNDRKTLRPGGERTDENRAPLVQIHETETWGGANDQTNVPLSVLQDKERLMSRFMEVVSDDDGNASI